MNGSAINKSFTPQYQTAITFCAILSGLGWLVFVFSIILGFVSLTNSSPVAGYEFIVFISSGIGGLMMVLSGQISRAVMDNTNANLEILNLLKIQIVDRNIEHHL